MPQISPEKTSVFNRLRLEAAPILKAAEQHFGPRFSGYRYMGIGFHAHAPCIAFPKANQVKVFLDQHARKDLATAFFQLAHESVHLLSPVRKNQVSVLEEGLAVWFSKQVLASYGFSHFPLERIIQSTRYATPFSLATQLLSIDPQIIRSIRKTEPIISKININHLHSHQSLPSNICEALTQKMHPQL